ncbi:MAG: HEAT repeat domain-containing protein [Actinomycetia bacterium]|nr:HEAT repeat domain-containing protein [Actinomycetes bacterium]
MGMWSLTPQRSIEAECERRGAAAVIDGCMSILVDSEVDDDLLWVLAGPASQSVIAGREGGRDGYWPRVWATRGLLYAWDVSAAQAIAATTYDEAWRVREMAAKVVARHRVEDAFDDMVRLHDDPVTRVRTAAERALMRLTRADG